jgi:mono/diheme cytochrome c family protein
MAGSDRSLRNGHRRTGAQHVALAASGLVVVAAFGTWGWQLQAGNPSGGPVEVLGEPVDAGTIALGQEIYAVHCGSCHGASLEGEPDWMERGPEGRMPAPPHDASGHTWHHSDQDLLMITREGLEALVPGYDSDMPAFGAVLSDAETVAVLAFIKSTWPERERAWQAEATRNDSP